MKNKKTRFSIYRYQLLPNSAKPLDLFDVFKTREELIEKKNEFLKRVVLDTRNKYRGKGSRIIGKIEYESGDDILMKIGVEKSKEIHRSDFNKETIKDYPNIDIYINNRKDKQYLIIQQNLDAFSDSNTVAKMLKASWQYLLDDFKLSIYVEQTFDENQFWDTVRMYAGRITALKFEFIKPNISNISSEIKKVFNTIENDLNSHTVNLDLVAPKSSVLENIEPGNEIVEGLLGYNKEGGGKAPYIRAKGVRKNIKTIKTESTIEIDEYIGSPEGLIEILNGKIK